MPMILDVLRSLGSRGNRQEELVTALEALLGRRQLWRVGRLVYRHARRDGPNDPARSGEYGLQDRVAKVAASRGQGIRVFDIGANVGEWSKHLLLACQRAGLSEVRLWAYEPSDEVCAVLVATLQELGVSYETHVSTDAVADKVGVARFDATPGLTQTKHLITGSADDVQCVEVKQTTVDKLLADNGLDFIEFVKSDVEGFDLAVLRGAQSSLQAGRIGVLQFEYNHRWVGTRSYLKDVFELIEGLPYQLCKIVPEGIDRYSAWHPELEAYIEANYVLVHQDWSAALGVRAGAFDPQNTYASTAAS